MIRTRRVYDPPSEKEQSRLLVDGIWPRGLRKETSSLDQWIHDIAPGKDLRESQQLISLS